MGDKNLRPGKFEDISSYSTPKGFKNKFKKDFEKSIKNACLCYGFGFGIKLLQ